MLAAYTWIMLAAYATCDDYPHNAYPWRFLNLKIYWLFGVHAGIIYIYIYIGERRGMKEEKEEEK